MINLRKVFLVLCLMLFVEAKAYKAKYTVDNGQVKASISVKDLTRIFILNDRISRVFGLTDEFVLQHEASKGQIFIRPRLNSKPLFISLLTEKGKTIDLFLLPKDVPSVSIGITINKG